jgi:hypothetical protein
VNETGLNSGLDGILGLSPDYESEPSYVMAMYNASLID